MRGKFSLVSKALFCAATVIYPIAVFYLLVIRKIPIRTLSPVVMAFALVAFIMATSEKGKKRPVSLFWTSLLLFGLGGLCLLTNLKIILKLYPLLMNLLFLTAFGSTLLRPPSMIYRFAVIMDKSIPDSPAQAGIAAYCRKVTFVWVGFFVCNGSMAAYTIFSGSDSLWALYNGGISYILMGILFAGEYLIRKKVQKSMPKFIPLSEMTAKSREPSAVLCYKGIWEDKDHKTWGDFLEATAILRRQIEAVKSDRWLIHSADSWYFLLAYVALLQCKKEVLLIANISPAYLVEIKGDLPFFTDQVFDGMENTFHIPALLEAAPVDGKSRTGTAGEIPMINTDEAYFNFFTSGTTGRPKQIRQCIKEFETDNGHILSEWGKEFYGRKICSTVSHHHIAGFVFSILLPFTAGIPFRRDMIRVPEELERFTDAEYFIITVPAFLKRAVELETSLSLHLKSPYILASGGFIFPELAKKVSEVFGVWPWEMYGLTETSGVAWRKQNEGIMWTPFPNCELWVNEDNCLVVRSAYIQTPSGVFETSDLVKMLPNGQFILMGRLDSIVKIEEKRVSLPEFETRITESGLVADVSVIPLEDIRQYLAAAIVFNAKGKEKFAGLEKNAINKFWREYLLQFFENVVIPKKWRYPESLPADAQGKKKREDIERLFVERDDRNESENT